MPRYRGDWNNDPEEYRPRPVRDHRRRNWDDDDQTYQPSKNKRNHNDDVDNDYDDRDNYR